MIKRSLSSLALLLALVFSMRATAAGAATIVFLGEGRGMDVSIHSPTLGDLTVRAGELNWYAAPPASGLATLFYAYCVDVNSPSNASQSVTVRPSDDLSIAGVDQAGPKAAWLVNTYATAVHNRGADLDAAALQVAIWAAMYNNNASLTSGAFRVNGTGPVTAQAQVFLNTLFWGPTGFRTGDAYWLDASNGQDQMIPAPEPGSMMLVGTGLLMAWRRRGRGQSLRGRQ